mgnify:CR=1 FL=1
MTHIRKNIQNIGTLNANKQREKVLRRLEKWYPQVNAFEPKLRPYDEQLQQQQQEM